MKDIVYTGGGIEDTLPQEEKKRHLGGSVLCDVCGRLTVDVARGVHDACRQRPFVPGVVFPERDPETGLLPATRKVKERNPGVVEDVEEEAREQAKRERRQREKDLTPRILVPEHVVEVDDLPRGPKAVANVIDEAWTTVWMHSEVEELEGPKRGGVAYGLAFRHPDGRRGWAFWARGSFQGAVLERPGPKMLKATELKEMLRHG